MSNLFTKNANTILVISCLVILGTLLFLPKGVETKKLTLGIEVSILSSPIWVAEHLGYFKDERLQVTIKGFDSGKDSFLQMLNNNSIDISTTAPTPIMFNSFERQDFSIIATFVHSYTDVKVIARKDSGITSAKDLENKRLGITFGTTGQFFANTFMQTGGIDQSKVSLINISPQALPHKLFSKQVDAVVIWEPHANKALHMLKADAIHIPTPQLYWETLNFMVMNNYAKKNQDTIVRFLRAIQKANLFIRHNKNEAQSIVATRLLLPIDNVRNLWEDFTFEVSLKQKLIDTLNDEAEWAINQGLVQTTTRPNYINFIDPSAVEELNGVDM